MSLTLQLKTRVLVSVLHFKIIIPQKFVIEMN